VIWTARELTPEDEQRVSALKEVVLQQKTPMRVMHRRAIMVRERTIHWCKLRIMQPHFAKLWLCTQSGTYIKARVHSTLHPH
jgi:tRNA pseudouridine synthase 10